MSETKIKPKYKSFFTRKNKEPETEQEKQKNAEEICKSFKAMAVFSVIFSAVFGLKAMYFDSSDLYELIDSTFITLMFLILMLFCHFSYMSVKTHWILREKINSLSKGEGNEIL
ncbi:hypothetical protein F1737_09015 [Methanoplanus sp. FWC-SCC4]|uniref:Uncharacterized protein n=1 Tax=Methanochimaera problematica TaxID=2609417 RepID=A0AA97FCC5_9EURY|nr:hypothetical protein [Methanoplanus sp. FWC-SCC4]WOF16820.1 hypothetical protein F1737_09015 [Methanoplanus sp. FWC-SCC4]